MPPFGPTQLACPADGDDAEPCAERPRTRVLWAVACYAGTEREAEGRASACAFLGGAEAAEVKIWEYRDGFLPYEPSVKERFESESGRARIEQVKKLATLAAEAGLSMSHMALLWCLRTPHVSTVILGASREDQLHDNLNALAHRQKFTPELAERIELVLDNTPEPPKRY